MSRQRDDVQLVASDAEASRFITHIDFDLIQEILRRLVVRCGADPDRVNTFLKEKLIVVTSANFGEHSSDSDEIGINIKAIAALQISERAKQLFALEVVVHEMCHQISHSEKDNFNEELQKYEHTRSGFNDREKGFDPQFVGLDEAFTQLMTRDVVSEYLRASGWMTEAEASELRKPLPEFEVPWRTKILATMEKWGIVPEHTVKRQRPRKSFPVVYGEVIALSNQLIDFFEKETGVSWDTVYQAFVREKIEGAISPTTDWRHIFVEAMGEKSGKELWEALAEMHPGGWDELSRDTFKKTVTELQKEQGRGLRR